jgi:putative membrane protein
MCQLSGYRGSIHKRGYGPSRKEDLVKLLTVGAAGVLAAMTTFGTGGMALAQQPVQPLAHQQAIVAQPEAAPPSQQDRNWMTENAQTDLAEITVGQLAAQKGGSQAIKQAGQTLANDHRQALTQLQQLAKSMNVPLPSSPNQMQQQQAQQLKGASGANFDQTFLRTQIQDHQTSINNTQQELKSGSNPQVKQRAQQYLPVAQKHLQMLQADQKRR